MSLGVEFGFQRPRWMGFKSLDASDGIRTTLLLVVPMIMAVYGQVVEPVTHAPLLLPALLVCCWSLITIAQLFRLAQIWGIYSAALQQRSTRRPISDDKIKRALSAGFKEHFVYLILSLIGFSALAFLSAQEVGIFKHIHITGGIKPANSLHIAIFLSTAAISFIPILTGIYLQVRKETLMMGRQHLLDTDVVSGTSMWITATVATLIVTLAWLAGAQKFNVGEDFGIQVTLAIILLFLAFVAAPHFLRFLNSRDANPPMNTAVGSFAPTAPERVISQLDSLLVRLVAPLTGATEKGLIVPHLIVISLLLPLTALGFELARPWGLAPICFGALLIFALGRRWAWVESDRDTASRLQSTNLKQANGIRIGFDNDLKDEALLGYAFLFVLVPLSLYQIDGAAQVFDGGSHSFQDWLRFFGAELAKAVPFVDWWEIYRVDVKSPIELRDDSSAMAKHLTFAARAMVDLVILAALIQAVGIWQRTRTQRRLYEEGHVNAFDPFTEEDFFERGMKIGPNNTFVPKKSFAERVKGHAENREALGLFPAPYSARRLGELIRSDNPEVRAGAKWMIEEFGVLAGSPQEKLEQLQGIWQRLNIVQLSASARHNDNAKERLRREKLRFEQLLLEIKQELALENEYLPLRNAGLLLGLLEEVQTGPEFTYARILALDLLATRNQSEFSLAAFAAHLMQRNNRKNHYEERPDWGQRIVTKFGRSPRVYLGNYEIRQYVYDALETFSGNLQHDSRRMTQLLDLLDWMSRSDSSQRGQQQARELAARVRAKNVSML
ncbi:MAG: hypothetical protein R3265_01105 [Hyphomonas sp.]|nr:hypothetical protein [Hyphomonas sp.]